jgi:hypothetical protein
VDDNIFIWLIVIAIAAFVGGRRSRKSDIETVTNSANEARVALRNAESEKRKTENQLDELKELYENTISDLRNDSVLLPSLTRWADDIQEKHDNIISQRLAYKKRPAKKAAEEVKIARAKARALKKESNIVLNRLDLYESLAPWLADYVDISVSELLAALREEREQQKVEDLDEDPVSKYISKLEWKQLSPTERNQLALDRYLDPGRKRSLWRVGIDYERFVGYQFECEGYSVEYHGATQGKEDLGIDLICKKDDTFLIVQCKRLSVVKEIPVRENVIAQVYGAAEYFRMDSEKGFIVKPVLITSYVLSEQAKRFASHLGVQTHESYVMGPYPMIKCNISQRDGEKIYHLPMDQQYDKVVVGDMPGECYTSTVVEAEGKGFRRAYRWKGGGTNVTP